MTTQEIQQYIETAISTKFDGFTSESEEIPTSPGGDGRFHGKVSGTMYSGLEGRQPMFVAIGETDKQAQIVKIGRSECLRPSTTDLDLILLKELGIETPGE